MTTTTETHHVYLPVCVPVNMDQTGDPSRPYVDFDGAPWMYVDSENNVWNLDTEEWEENKDSDAMATAALAMLLAEGTITKPQPRPLVGDAGRIRAKADGKPFWTGAALNALADLVEVEFDIDYWVPGDDVDTDGLVQSFVALAAAALEGATT